jgi:hypothetical protein
LWEQANLLWSNSTGRLLEPLGPWIFQTAQRRQRHQAYVGRHTDAERDVSIWVRVDGEYMRCESDQDMWTYRETGYTTSWECIPDEGTFPVEVRPNEPGKWKLFYTGNVFIPNYRGPKTGGSVCWESELLQMIELYSDAFTVSEALSYGLRVLSDGSVWDGDQ